MNAVTLYLLSGVGLVVVCLYGLFVQGNLVRKILALNILGSGVFMLLTALARRSGGPDPDPVPHAMVLTGIVVAVSATAFALALARRVQEQTGRSYLPEDDPEGTPDG